MGRFFEHYCRNEITPRSPRVYDQEYDGRLTVNVVGAVVYVTGGIVTVVGGVVMGGKVDIVDGTVGTVGTVVVVGGLVG